MNSNKPFFTIITPLFNEGLAINISIESVLVQNFNNYEHIVINSMDTQDPCYEETIMLLDKYKAISPNLKIIENHTSNRSAGKNKQLGLDQAQGTYVLFLDSTDTLIYGSLNKVHDFIMKNDHNNEIHVFHGNFYINISEKNFFKKAQVRTELKLGILTTFNLCGWFFKTSFVQEVSNSIGEDIFLQNLSAIDDFSVSLTLIFYRGFTQSQYIDIDIVIWNRKESNTLSSTYDDKFWKSHIDLLEGMERRLFKLSGIRDSRFKILKEIVGRHLYLSMTRTNLEELDLSSQLMLLKALQTYDITIDYNLLNQLQLIKNKPVSQGDVEKFIYKKIVKFYKKSFLHKIFLSEKSLKKFLSVCFSFLKKVIKSVKKIRSLFYVFFEKGINFLKSVFSLFVTRKKNVLTYRYDVGFLSHRLNHTQYYIDIAYEFLKISPDYNVAFIVMPHKEFVDMNQLSLLLKEQWSLDFYERCAIMSLEEFYSTTYTVDIFIDLLDWTSYTDKLLSYLRKMRIQFFLTEEGHISLRNEYDKYQKGDFVFLHGEVNTKFYPKGNYAVTGYNDVYNKYHGALNSSPPEEDLVLINLNFSYNVGFSLFDIYIHSIVECLQELGLPFLFSVHPAILKNEWFVLPNIVKNNMIDESFEEALSYCSLLISRGSTVIYEALALNRAVILYDIGNSEDLVEGVLTENAEGAFSIAYDRFQLKKAIEYELSRKNNVRENAQKYLEYHHNVHKEKPSKTIAKKLAQAIY